MDAYRYLSNTSGWNSKRSPSLTTQMAFLEFGMHKEEDERVFWMLEVYERMLGRELL